MKKKIVIAGFGDTGVLAAIHLKAKYDIIGVTPKPCLVSGQELGVRLSDPTQWMLDYCVPFSRYKRLDGVAVRQALITHIDPVEKKVSVVSKDGIEDVIAYDALLIASGITNGFWRNQAFQTQQEVENSIEQFSSQLLGASRIAVVGGGATGVGVSSALVSRYPEKDVHLFYSQALPLPDYHPRVREHVAKRLLGQGVQLHAGFRAEIPAGFNCDAITHAPITWQTNQAAFSADAVLWAVGNTRPNNTFIPPELLDAKGYVRVDRFFCAPDADGIFAVGDIAASDRLRSSARNGGYKIVAKNIEAYLRGQPEKFEVYKPSEYRWGSVTGVGKDGLLVYQPNGKTIRFPKWSIGSILFPLIVRKGIYKGMRKP